MGVTLSLHDPGLDDEDVQALAVDLCRTLNDETDVEARLPEGAGAAGAKGDPVTIGAIVLAFITSGAAVKLFDVLKPYFARHPKVVVVAKRGDGKTIQIRAEDVGSARIRDTIALARGFLEDTA